MLQRPPAAARVAQAARPAASRALAAARPRAARRGARAAAAARVIAYAGMKALAGEPSTGPPTFMDEMRSFAMKLHTREQAPRQGEAEAPKDAPAWAPTRAGYLRFLAESRVVYAAFEEIVAAAPAPFLATLRDTGLERVAAIDADLAAAAARWGDAPPAAAPDGPGARYAARLRELAATNAPAFTCHFYNFYFAHTAGGRMIGAQVAKACLEGWVGDFYKWDGDVKAMLNEVRARLNEAAEGWSREEKDACLNETPATFGASGELLRLIGGGGGH
jgi:heme oxygenase